MLILMIEGDLNTARLILPSTARGHPGAGAPRPHCDRLPLP